MLLPSKLKLIATVAGLAVVIGVPAWAAWTISADRATSAANKRADQRVEALTIEANRRYEAQQILVHTYRTLSQEQFAKLLNQVENIQVVHTTVTNNITTERSSNPEFYEQQLPEGGIKEWDNARNLLR